MPWWAWSWSLPVIDGFNELHCCCELHPPVRLLSRQTAGVEAADVLHGWQQAGWVCLDRRKTRKSHHSCALLGQSIWAPGLPVSVELVMGPSTNCFRNTHLQDLERNPGKEPIYDLVKPCGTLHRRPHTLSDTSKRPTFISTNTNTGTKSSAPGTESSLARLRRFMMVEHILRMHCTLSRGVL